MENTAHWNTRVAHLPWQRHSLQPLTLCLCLARHEIWAHLRSQSRSLQSLNCPTVELPLLYVHSVQERSELPFIERLPGNTTITLQPPPSRDFHCSTCPLPSRLPEAHASKQLCFLDGHSPFVFLSTATGFLVSAVSNSS